MNRICKICGEVLGHQNKSGYCSGCGQSIKHKLYYEKYFKSVRLVEEKTGEIGVCHMPGCGKGFELVSWQHSTIHYCPTCQKKKRYGEYKKYYKKSIKKEIGDEKY